MYNICIQFMYKCAYSIPTYVSIATYVYTVNVAIATYTLLLWLYPAYLVELAGSYVIGLQVVAT